MKIKTFFLQNVLCDILNERTRGEDFMLYKKIVKKSSHTPTLFSKILSIKFGKKCTSNTSSFINYRKTNKRTTFAVGVYGRTCYLTTMLG